MLDTSKHSVSLPSASPLFCTPSVEDLRARISLELKSTPLSSGEVDALLAQVRAAAVPVQSEYFMNQLFSGISPESVKAQEVVAETKATMSTFEASTIFALIEMELVGALGKVIGWDPEVAEGLTVPGGSAANFMAIHCARQKKFPDSKAKGNQGRVYKIFVSEHSHYSWKKAALSLGLGVDNVVLVTTDIHGRLRADDLEQKIDIALHAGEIPLMVAATSGTTVYGAFDPLSAIHRVCTRHDVWLHVDAAWGGPVMFSSAHRQLMEGVELADSMTFDAHKLIGTGLTCSFFLTRRRGLLMEANDVTGADYLFHEAGEVDDRGRLSWQCGRSADALMFWAIWKRLGSDGLGQLVDRLMNVAKEFVDYIDRQERLQLMMEPEFLNICVQVIPPRENIDPATWSKMVRNHLKETNQVMVNYSTDDQGITFIRFILAHPQLQFNHLKDMIDRALRVRPEDLNP